MKNFIFFCYFLLSLLTLACGVEEDVRESLDLSGQWSFSLDGADVGVAEKWYSKEFTQNVILPGTTDTNKQGQKNEYMGETRFLSRNFLYEGKAWYQRQVVIPLSWKGSRVELFIERSKPTTLWVDDVCVDSEVSLTMPHVYDLTPYVEAGQTHRLTVVCDNKEERLPKMVFNSHCNCNDTQTNWNGLVGAIELRKCAKSYIQRVKLTPKLKAKSLEMEVLLEGLDLGDGYSLKVVCSDKDSSLAKMTIANVKDSTQLSYPMGDDFKLWSDATPHLYDCRVSLLDSKGEVVDVVTQTFGMREFTAKGMKLYNNGKRVFLRGKHDGAVFPKEAYAPMDTAQWGRYLRICQDYGINHVRFHSWCPPIAAVQMADKLGIYLQIELPFWGTMYPKKDKDLKDYLYTEAKKILDTYANHPSVVLMALGNELKGDTTEYGRIVTFIKNQRPELLAATGSNNYLGCYGPHSKDDFSVVCRIGGSPSDANYDKNVRASFAYVDALRGGYINNYYPNSTMTFSKAFENGSVPVIGHETGQYQCYPSFEEANKYDGVLSARNMDTFKEKVAKAGLLEQAEKFRIASGAWQVELYKADIEMNLRTDEISGFQLLDIQDYPGQGTALVGILDAFMDSKGFVEPHNWRRFCSAVVPLAILDKFVYETSEQIDGLVKISNYSAQSLSDVPMTITLEDEAGNQLYEQKCAISAPESALTEVAKIDITLPEVAEAQKLTLSIECGSKNIANSYSIWVYPSKKELANSMDVIVARKIDKQLYANLAKGEKVLLIPTHDQLKSQTIEGLFMTDYWNYRMFRLISQAKKSQPSPGTLGMLIDNNHKALASFPTSFHTDMQWFSIVTASRPLIMNNLPHFEPPIVQVIDNVERNFKLGLVIECKVGKGKLLICMSDLPSLTQYPEARTLYNSLVEYAQSDSFNPSNCYTVADIKRLFTTPVPDIELENLVNVSYQYKEGDND